LAAIHCQQNLGPINNYLKRGVSSDLFQSEFISAFKNDIDLSETEYDILDELFGDVDSFTRDDQLLNLGSKFYISETELKTKAEQALVRLSGLKDEAR
jgi:Bacterial self-protective colicin-like immunity